MKNTFYKLGLFVSLLLIILSSFIHKVEAKFLAPFFDVKIIVNTSGGNAEFNYTLLEQPAHSPAINDRQEFSLQTAIGTAEKAVSTIVGNGDDVYLYQKKLNGWDLANISCFNGDTKINTEPLDYPNGDKGVKITASPLTSIVCTFSNTKTKNPVIIIPGALSSYLNRNDDAKTEIWPNILKALFGLPGDRYLDELMLNPIGESKTPILATDIFRKIGNNDFFDGLIKKLEANGYEENKNLFVFPYDWRLDIRTIDLKTKVNQILQTTGATKVDLIAHSMGGLLAKYYIEHNGTSTVDKFIDIATPHLGAPAAFKTLMYGDDMGIKFGFLGLNSGEMKKIVQNMPSIYQLLPSVNYFSLAGQATSSPDYKYYLYDMDDVDHDKVRGRLNFAQTKQFLKNTGHNDVLLDSAPNIHNDLDFMNPADYGVKAYNIVSCGVPTFGKFFTLGQKNLNDEYYDVGYISGDGTVPEKSARSFPSIQEYQEKGIDHAVLPSSLVVKNLITSILADQAPIASTSTADCTLPDGDLLSFHGPIQVDIYDTNGNHTGPILGSAFEHNVPGVAYDLIANNIFAYLPLAKELKIKVTPIVATSTSKVTKTKTTVTVKKVKVAKVVTTKNYIDIPLSSASSTIIINTNPTDSNDTLPVLNLDNNGDGTDVQTVPVTATIDGDSLDDQDPSITDVNVVTGATSTAVTFTSTSTDVVQTEYSTDGGINYTEATSTVIITNTGTTTITYHSTDTAGNIEEAKQIDVFVATSTNGTLISTTTTATSTEATTSPEATTSNPDPVILVTESKNIVVDNYSASHGSSGGSSKIIIPTSSVLLAVVPVAPKAIFQKPEAKVIKSQTSTKTATAIKIKKMPDNLAYSAVASAKVGNGKIWWLILLLIILLILLILIRLKREKEVKLRPWSKR